MTTKKDDNHCRFCTKTFAECICETDPLGDYTTEAQDNDW